MKRWIVVGGIALLALSLGGCITSDDAAKYARADEALRRNPVFVRDYNACVRSDGFDRGGNYPTDLLGWGTTRDASFFQCMERAGWVQSPRWNPAAIGRYERRPERPQLQTGPSPRALSSSWRWISSR